MRSRREEVSRLFLLSFDVMYLVELKVGEQYEVEKIIDSRQQGALDSVCLKTYMWRRGSNPILFEMVCLLLCVCPCSAQEGLRRCTKQADFAIVSSNFIRVEFNSWEDGNGLQCPDVRFAADASCTRMFSYLRSSTS